MSALFGNLVRFARLLRDLGLDVAPTAAVEAARALEYVDLGRRREFFFALRAVLVHRAQDLPLFERAFAAFWRAPAKQGARTDLRSLGEDFRPLDPQLEEASLQGGGDAGERARSEIEQRIALATFSAREALRRKDFARMSADEYAQARAFLAELRWSPSPRRTARRRAGDGPEADPRRLLRALWRNPGESFVLPRRERKLQRRPIVLLCDISGSMERYTRMLLHFAHALAGAYGRVEAFVFATRLTRITRELRQRGADRALAALPDVVADWGSGTRIGEALRRFHLDWARRALGRGAVVLLISDGWDRGDPVVLAREAARLQRSCHRFVWLNPLLASPGYEPLTRGLQAALPFVDDFLPVHNLASLEDLAVRLNALPSRRAARR